MQSLLALPYEVQIVLLAGYIGYRISTIGRSVNHRTEDFLLQVLAFGTIGRLAAAAMMQLISYFRGSEYPLSENASLLVIAGVAICVSATSAAWWRSSLQSRWVKWMNAAGVYRDDHQGSVWASILETRATWHCVLVHSEDGQIYETDFRKLPSKLPLGRITLNEDGVAIYVTRVYRKDDTSFEVTPSCGDYGSLINYFPRSTIKRIEVAWGP